MPAPKPYERPQDPENIYNVPKSQWRKWTRYSKELFNDVYGLMLESQDIYKHPKASRMPHDHWKTIVWNAAWTAAHECKA